MTYRHDYDLWPIVMIVSMTYDLWPMIYDLWPMIYDLWLMIYGYDLDCDLWYDPGFIVVWLVQISFGMAFMKFMIYFFVWLYD